MVQIADSSNTRKMAISHDHHGNVSLMSDACGLSVVIINKVSIIMARVEDMQMILNAIVHNDLWVRRYVVAFMG